MIQRNYDFNEVRMQQAYGSEDQLNFYHILPPKDGAISLQRRLCRDDFVESSGEGLGFFYAPDRFVREAHGKALKEVLSFTGFPSSINTLGIPSIFPISVNRGKLEVLLNGSQTGVICGVYLGGLDEETAGQLLVQYGGLEQKYN
ncbi:hypothetical protein H6501_04335 [Candidatus Woesearchaeota archaeon]|nr:hypothetical protein [Nanoarchaeota archaeon]MCB9370799.1 hypothetical protein [Candidatus Woesearchaeota archaeon]USN43899.1 MAG: hypothetical protein H6500_05935 [Candidatus Woesearchaeota archaeon]